MHALSTLITFALALTPLASAASISCAPPISSGILHVFKSSASNTLIPLAFNGTWLSTSPSGSQPVVQIVPCSSTHIGKPATQVSPDKSAVTVYGKIKSDGKCLSRVAADQGVKLVACANEDGAAQDAQFWTVALMYHPGDEATGSGRHVSFVKAGYYHQLASGKVYETTSKPPSNWFLTFSYVE